jgi:hypothetical protein
MRWLQEAAGGGGGGSAGSHEEEVENGDDVLKELQDGLFVTPHFCEFSHRYHELHIKCSWQILEMPSPSSNKFFVYKLPFTVFIGVAAGDVDVLSDSFNNNSAIRGPILAIA